MAPSDPKNAAFVFVKPHAVTEKTIELVRDRLVKKGLSIITEGSIKSEDIDQKKLIDQHYYAIASKATILKPAQLNIPKDKFKAHFDKEWDECLEAGLCLNAMDACEKFGCTADELNTAWALTKKENKLVKFGGGFYCGLVSMKDKEFYVFNGFFMNMRAAFTKPGGCIHYFTVEWSGSELSWEDFRGKVLGPTDPKDAPKDSLRGEILADWELLGLTSCPNVGDNGVHASASPFEGLAERLNWLGADCANDVFGKALMEAGLDKEMITSWSVDPQVKIDEDKMGSLFDSLEDMDAQACLEKAKALQALNK